MRRSVAALIVLSVLGGGYVLFFSELLGVRSVEVTGAHGVSTREVRVAAGVPMGRPMLRLDTSALASRVEGELRRVETAEVSRSWPSTVRIEVTERVPVATVGSGSDLRLVDGAAVDFAPEGTVPKGLPKLRIRDFAQDDPASVAAVRALVSLPVSLSRRVAEVRAETAGSVEFTLRDNRVVRWGDTAKAERKAAVLRVLLERPGKVFDVSSPALPTVSQS